MIPLIFFRSPDADKWKIYAKKHPEIESFCFSKVKEIIEKVQPEKILIIGFGTYNLLKRHIFGHIPNMEEEIYYRITKNTDKLAILSECPIAKLFTTIHLTGARPPLIEKEMEKLRELFLGWITS